MVEVLVSSSDSKRRIEELEAQVQKLQAENDRLREREQAQSTETERSSTTSSSTTNVPQQPQQQPIEKLSADHIERYSRQLLLSNGFGVNGQLRLLNSSVLIVGAGGIGSTVILYLAAAGVGSLTIVDFDSVERSNLHRQVIHSSHKVGRNKAESAKQAALALNPSIQIQAMQLPLTHDNALELVKSHDCVVDASDNPQTRYVVNDACFLASTTTTRSRVPLVSASAIGTEGQLTVYHHTGNGCCYRCLYPKPPPDYHSKSCSDHGVLGPVPGLMGVLQATEVIKILTNTGLVLSDRLLLYDALQCSFLSIQKPSQPSSKCPLCGPQATIHSMEDSRCASTSTRGPSCNVEYNDIPPLDQKYNVTCQDYQRLRESDNDEQHEHVLLDVRAQEQFALCALEGAINIPLEDLTDQLDQLVSNKPIYCICRRGRASVAATQLLLEQNPTLTVRNIQGGLNAWRETVDPSFPKY